MFIKITFRQSIMTMLIRRSKDAKNERKNKKSGSRSELKWTLSTVEIYFTYIKISNNTYTVFTEKSQ